MGLFESGPTDTYQRKRRIHNPRIWDRGDLPFKWQPFTLESMQGLGSLLDRPVTKGNKTHPMSNLMLSPDLSPVP